MTVDCYHKMAKHKTTERFLQSILFQEVNQSYRLSEVRIYRTLIIYLLYEIVQADWDFNAMPRRLSIHFYKRFVPFLAIIKDFTVYIFFTKIHSSFCQI